MSEWSSTPQFEETIRQSFGVPKIRSEFVNQGYANLMQLASAKSRKSRTFFGLRPAWAIALAIFSLLIIGTLAIGPQRVYAAVLQLFGYIPGVGIVDQSSPIRLLAEPVSQTRDGITVSVNQAVLTAGETQIDYGISGVPLSAYPKEEAVSGCIEPEYLRLPDGTRIEINAPIPETVNEAAFILPCIFNTLPGTVPTDWELPLHFVAAPADLTILPVIDVSPQVTPTENEPALESVTPSITSTESPQATVSVDKIIETEDGYILLGYVHPNIPEGSWLQITGAPTILDADGKTVNYSRPNDVQELAPSGPIRGGTSWVMQIKGQGIKFPLTIHYSGVIISQVDPQASAQMLIDIGTNPQAGQTWDVNQDVQLAGNTIRLVSITAGADGYSFRINPGPALSGVSIQIEGHAAIGGGGGGLPILGQEFTTSLVFNELPQGELSLLFSNPKTVSLTESWEVQWQPELLREFPTSSGSSGICLAADSIQSLNQIPAGITGKAVLTQQNPQLQIIAANLDGSRQQVIATGSSRAALSQDSSHLAYSGDENLVIVDLTSGESTLIPGVFGPYLRWSPDGSRIAVVNSGDSFGVFVIGIDDNDSTQLSNLGYESIAGWSPDGSSLYYAIPGSGGDGFLLRSVELSTGNTQDLFVLENSSRKAPLPVVSPDGKWIAYRASDNSSLYLKGMDGSQTRLLLESPGSTTAITGLVWNPGSHWLGVSLLTPENSNGEIILLAPESCEAYQIPGLSGELDGLIIP